MVKSLSNVDIIYNREVKYSQKPLQFSLKVTEETYLKKFLKVIYTIKYTHQYNLTYDLNIKEGLYTKALFTYYNPVSRKYLVEEAYCFFSDKYRNRPILFGFKTISDDYYYYTYYELLYARKSYTIEVKGIHKILSDRLESRLNQEADIIEKENTLKGTYKKGYGCIYLGNKGTNTNEYVVNLGSKVLCSIKVSKEQCSYCKNVEVVIYKIVYIGDPQYHLWEHTWYQWSNSYYYIYVYSGKDVNHEGKLIYKYYPRYNDYTAIYVFVFYSVLYVNDPFYIVFRTKQDYNLISTFDVIKNKGSGYSYDFVSVTNDDVPHNVKEAYSKYRKLKFEIGRFKNQHVSTFPPQDSESSRLTYGGKKYKKVIFTPDQLSYQVTGHILFSCRLFSINPSEDSCPYISVQTQKTSSDEDKIRNKPIKDHVLKDVNNKDFNGVIVFYTNDQIKIDKSFQGTRGRENRDRSSDRFTVPENVAILVEFIVNCDTKTQFVRQDVDGNEWVQKSVDYKSDDELVNKLNDIVKSLDKSESRKKFEEELELVKAKTKPETPPQRPPAPAPRPQPPPQQPPPPPTSPPAEIPTDVRQTTSPTHSGKPTETERTSQKPTSSRDSGPKSQQPPTERPGGPSLKQTPAQIPSLTPSGQDSRRTSGRPSPPGAPPQPKGKAPKTSKEVRGPGVSAEQTRTQTGRPGLRQPDHQKERGPKPKVHQPIEKPPESPAISTLSQTTHRHTTPAHKPPKESRPEQSQGSLRVSPQGHPKDPVIPPLIQSTTKKAIVIFINKQSPYDYSDSFYFSYLLDNLENYTILNNEDTINVENKDDSICEHVKNNGFKLFEHNFTNILKSDPRSHNEVELKVVIEDNFGHNILKLYNSDDEDYPVPLYYQSGEDRINVYFYQNNDKPLLFCYNGNGYRTTSHVQYDYNWFKSGTITNCLCLKPNETDVSQLLQELEKVKEILKIYDTTQHIIIDEHLGDLQDTSITTDDGSKTSKIIGGSVGGVVSTAAVVGTGTGVALKFPEVFIPVIKALT